MLYSYEYVDILSGIFSHLSLNDIKNVMYSCKHMASQITKFVFSRKCKLQYVRDLYPQSDHHERRYLSAVFGKDARLLDTPNTPEAAVILSRDTELLCWIFDNRHRISTIGNCLMKCADHKVMKAIEDSIIEMEYNGNKTLVGEPFIVTDIPYSVIPSLLILPPPELIRLYPKIIYCYQVLYGISRYVADTCDDAYDEFIFASKALNAHVFFRNPNCRDANPLRHPVIYHHLAKYAYSMNFIDAHKRGYRFIPEYERFATTPEQIVYLEMIIR